ncbi:MAG: PKD domain-containing protein [Bacteroidales bacterium]|nr:PKD domain-containing protein [Bacteroidales bacterium]
MCYNIRFAIALASLIVFSFASQAQQNGKSSYSLKKSFSETVKFDRANPDLFNVEHKRPNKEKYVPQFDIEKEKIVYRDAGRTASSWIKSADPSPLPDLDFLGLEDNNSSIPPDVHGAAGPDHLMVTLNTQIRIMDKTGNVISTVSTGSFWYPLPGSGDVFDPKVIYDPYDQRWILIMPSSSNVQSSALFVGVSENADPTGNWFLYSFDADPENKWWFDYPSYGFNKKWIAVSGNMFGDGFGYNVLFVINKHDLYDGLPEAGFNRFALDNAFTIVPAYTYDPEEEDMYMVMRSASNSGGYGYIKLFRLTGSLGSEIVEEIGLAGVPSPWDNYAGESGNFAPQKDSEKKINSGDSRIQNVIFRNGKIWCAHHIFLPAGNPTRSAIQWWELLPDGTILQHGRVDDTTGYFHYTFPSIAVNAKEDILIGYSGFSPGQYPGCSYSFRYADDPPNTLRDRYEYKEGLASYFKDFGASRNRWGDYSGTVIDPCDDLDFWTLQEYADMPGGGYDRWGTWWAKIEIDAAPEAGLTSNITTVPVGSGVNFTDLSKFEPLSWFWIFEGASPEFSTVQNPVNIIYNQEGTFDVTLIATNNLGSDTLYLDNYITANYTILPAVAFSISDTLPCTSHIVSLTDNTVYNPVSWLWEFSPDEVTFANGTSASSQNPEVIFNLPVKYSVSLTAGNLNGSSSLTRENSISSGGVYLPFEEDFETKSFYTRSWAIDNPDGMKTWEITETAGNGPGLYSSFINLRYYNGLGERDRLVSPLINLSGMNTALLEFKYAYAQRFPDFTDSLIVYLVKDCGEEWVRLLALAEDSLAGFATHPPESGSFYPESGTDWCGSGETPPCHLIDLSAWVGNPDVSIVFEAYVGYGNNLFIDDVVVRSIDNISLSKSGEDGIQIWPNPNDGGFMFSLEGQPGRYKVEIRNLSGNLMLDQSWVSYGNQLSGVIRMDEMPPGVYLLSVNDGKSARHARIIHN